MPYFQILAQIHLTFILSALTKFIMTVLETDYAFQVFIKYKPKIA